MTTPMRARLAALLERMRAIRPRTILVAAWLFAIAYAFPGYTNWDAEAQLGQARAATYGDSHPALMAVWWRGVEKIVHGPFGMLVLQTTLFLWALDAALRTRFEQRTAALLAAALFVFPPILTPMSVAWKDAQMASALLAGTMLALQPPWRARAFGLVLLFYAVGVRHNAPAALPPLVILIVASWGIARKIAIVAIAAGVTIAITASAMAVNAAIATREYGWYRGMVPFDLTGTLCQLPALSDDDVRAELAGIPLLVDHDLQHALCVRYDPRTFLAVTNGEGRVFGDDPDETERDARMAAWQRVVRDHPAAYLEHRWRVMKEVLGLSGAEIWEPVCQEFDINHAEMVRLGELHTHSWFQRRVGRIARWFATTWVYRPWVYLLLGLVAIGYAIRRRDGFLVALATSGTLYELTYFLLAPSPDFRYSHWMVTCTTIALAIIAGERFRAGLRSRSR